MFEPIRRSLAARSTARVAASRADMAAAARAYQHLRWRDPGAITEAFAVLPRIPPQSAPALYTALTRALLRAAIKDVDPAPNCQLMNQGQRHLRARLVSEPMTEARAREVANALVLPRAR